MVNKTDLIEGAYYIFHNGHTYKYNGLNLGGSPTFVINLPIQDVPKGVVAMYAFQKTIDRLPIKRA